jgi:DNA-binding transcriptional MerR regulator
VAKGPEAFRTISEAAAELGVAQHVLRFWETKFPFIKPMKRAGGRRFYRPGDIAVLATVSRLLRQEGYTIRGVQKLHREGGLKASSATMATPSPARAKSDAPVRAPIRPAKPGGAENASLRSTLASLAAAKARLDAVLGLQ